MICCIYQLKETNLNLIKGNYQIFNELVVNRGLLISKLAYCEFVKEQIGIYKK